MLDHDTIRSFIKVAECSSFSKAAELLHKTPAAISYRIKTLEDDVGTQLFLRTTRSVSLTPAGVHLLEQCRMWLSWLDSVPNELRQITDGIERQVNIVVNNLLYDEDTCAGLLSYLHQKFPFTQFQVSCQIYMGVWDNLLYGDCQMAIGATGSESLSNNIQILPLGGVEWVFVVAPIHPLAKGPEVLTEEMLRGYPAINIEDTSKNLTKRIAWLLPGQKEIKVPDLGSKLKCHLNGLGVGFLPRKLCQPYLNSGQLITKTIQNSRHPSQLSLAWNNEKDGQIVHHIVSLFKSDNPIIHGFLQNVTPGATKRHA
ncbi:HTH-type transcriptional activator AllS [Pragia fontium]|uniref:LysR family transcriptional regulator, transcriptional activator of the allD operon n=2 Tax=Pragia fontium TaxID=82985 RepID=A0AAJ4WAD4_9GAMM|nr:HTH-type transcriptional activator AllS [Pragia fontium]AKJ42504.1 transcriptional regulator [Pragia fontium]SFC74638.1 LysR family transcriptional regulator, transcriptional activator of the allD operon [Pragia fontium DSM 5563 = ATCC 49100]SUB82821.1 HTH-type transcriptional activator AllS [Pragia fontium]VEJ55718.1 HTH-type transcriptional activator AllS [Pragia fontium]GKX62672.1 LysR family transcriptional regulator [Pragia fontium]